MHSHELERLLKLQPQKQVKAREVSIIIGLKLVAALKSVHEGTQHLTVESTTVKTGLKASTGIETKEYKIECSKHKDSK